MLRQLGEMFPESILAITRELADPTVNPIHRRGFGRLLKEKLTLLAELLNCTPADLHLDHDPALAVRLKFIEMPNGLTVRGVLVPKGGTVLRYSPDANDPEYLFYRVKAAHDVKTRVRGERGQLSDLSLMKKLRKLDRKRLAPKPKKAWGKGRKMQGHSSFPKGRKFAARPVRER